MTEAASRSMKGSPSARLLAPCPTGWDYDPKDTVAIGRLAVAIGAFLLEGYVDGRVVHTHLKASAPGPVVPGASSQAREPASRSRSSPVLPMPMLPIAARRRRYFSLKRAGFLLPFAAATLPIQAWLQARSGMPADLAAWLPVLVVFGVIPLLDLVIGGDAVNPSDDESAALAKDRFYRVLLLMAVPFQLASVAFGAWAFTHWELGPVGMVGWVAAVGTVSGSIGINVGHELIHKYARLDQWAGGVLLSSSLYPGFKIEHVLGHHVDVGTPKDNTTARFGQSVYAYLLLAFATNFRKAWCFERERLAGLGLPVLHWRNELVGWYALCAAFALALGLAFGWLGVVFFVAQAVFGIALLEIVNYIEHYGLERGRLPDGRYEPVSVMHSWNSDALLTNLFLFHLQRHADHHRYARRPYQILRSIPEAPQLPTGYAGMIVLALVPPLWFAVMNPRAAAVRAVRG